jgi:hypothetical protein
MSSCFFAVKTSHALVQSEEDQHLKDQLEMLVERLKVRIGRKYGIQLVDIIPGA